MYLTRMEIDPLRRESIIALATPSRFHGAIESAFPGERARRLWRVDRLMGKTYLLILSEERPDLTSACQQFAPQGAGWETRDYEPLLNRLADDTRWRFKLCANPTYSDPRPNQRGRVCAHTTTENQRRWLMQQSAKNGFALDEDMFDVTHTQWYRFRKNGVGCQVSMLAVTYEGVLQITDAKAFRKMMTEGIGREKAYGVGMMTLMRAEED